MDSTVVCRFVDIEANSTSSSSWAEAIVASGRVIGGSVAVGGPAILGLDDGGRCWIYHNGVVSN
jgi:hypothetical protein